MRLTVKHPYQFWFYDHLIIESKDFKEAKEEAMSKLTFCFSALAARSNMGFELPTTDEAVSALKRCNTLGAFVEAFCQQFMEDEDHYDLFYRKAESWVNRVGFLEEHPHIRKLFE